MGTHLTTVCIRSPVFEHMIAPGDPLVPGLLNIKLNTLDYITCRVSLSQYLAGSADDHRLTAKMQVLFRSRSVGCHNEHPVDQGEPRYRPESIFRNKIGNSSIAYF